MVKKILIISIPLILVSYEYEPSAYGAGNIDSSSPYGLTRTEKSVLNNRQEIQELKNRVEEQQHKIKELITIIDELNREIFSLKERIGKNQQNLKEIKDNNRTENILIELTDMVEQINSNYVTFEDLRGLERKKLDIEEPDIATIYKKGIDEFKRRNYNKAKEYFTKAIQQNYKIASSSFYLGEINYFTENYHEAIELYKRSASIYDKASYMKYLYLHTAISLKKVGDIRKANEFFQFIIDTYPNSKVAEIARENLLR